MQRGFAPIIILVGILVIAAVAGEAYYFGKSQSVKPEALPSPNPVVTSKTPQPTAVSQTIPMPSPNSADETFNWKTYTNSQSQYSLKYPNDWQLKSENGILGTDTTKTTLQSNDLTTKTINTPGVGGEQLTKGSKLEIVLSLNPNFKSYEQLKDFMDNQSTMFPLNYFTSSEEITVNGVKATVRKGGKTTTLALGNTFCYFFRNGITYNLTFTNSENDNTLFNQILSTFKFTQ